MSAGSARSEPPVERSGFRGLDRGWDLGSDGRPEKLRASGPGNQTRGIESIRDKFGPAQGTTPNYQARTRGVPKDTVYGRDAGMPSAGHIALVLCKLSRARSCTHFGSGGDNAEAAQSELGISEEITELRSRETNTRPCKGSVSMAENTVHDGIQIPSER